MKTTELSLAFLQKKQAINIKLFLIPFVASLSCFILWLVLVIGGIPRTGRIICFIILVINPIAIIAYLMKLKIDELKRNAKLFANGLYISKMILANIESDTSATDTVTYCLEFVSNEKGENASGFTHSVSYKEYKNAVIGNMYYAIHLQHEDKFGKKFFLEGVYLSEKYQLSDELTEHLIDYSEIKKANSAYTVNYYANKK